MDLCARIIGLIGGRRVTDGLGLRILQSRIRSIQLQVTHLELEFTIQKRACIRMVE